MIFDDDIKFILEDMLLHTKEILKFLRKLENEKYNPLLDDLICYALGNEEDIQNIKHYIYELEIQLYSLLNGGDV